MAKFVIRCCALSLCAFSVALLTAAIPACSHDDAGASAATPAADAAANQDVTVATELTPDSACRTYIETVCKRRMECSQGPTYAGCRDLEAVCPEYLFSAGSTRTVESVLDCAREYAAQPCEDVNAGRTLACSTPGSRQNGEACLFGSQCKSFFCDSPRLGDCGACAVDPFPILPTGSACAAGDQCERGDCILGSDGGNTGTCGPLPSRGPCAKVANGDGRCEAPAVCATAQGGETNCVPRVPAGESCEPTAAVLAPTCADRTYCNHNESPAKCRPLPSAGEICSDGVTTTQCSGDLYCNTAESPGRCRAPVGEGKTCGTVGDGPYVPCAAPTFCDGKSESGVCAPPRNVGESCAFEALAQPSCAVGLRCVSAPLDDGGQSFVCANELGGRRGDACGLGIGTCVSYLRCVDGRCALADPATCSSDAGSR